MYVEKCDTDSQPRKAISHIFGRNKLCTRLIPNHVWVHFCRKHYQRSRYRNAQEYAKLQCDLVLQQIQRVQAWSEENKRQNKAGVVQDWSLTVRKREQKRLEDKSAAGKKRRYQDEDMDDLDEFSNDHAVANGTAVPQWLLEKTASGYSTMEIEAIVRQLKGEMDENRIAQIPDIEILPNILTDAADQAKSKPYPKRKPSNGTAHKRSQSVGVSLRAAHEPYSMARRVSQPSNHYWPAPEFGSPAEKRPRIDGFADEFYPRNPDHAVPAMRHMAQLPHRPAFNDIRENRTETRFYDDRQPVPTASSFTFGVPLGSQGPLPAPMPRRLSSAHMAEQLESNQTPGPYSDPRSVARPGHQRSYSDATFHQSQHLTYRSPSSQAYQGFPVGAGLAPNGYSYEAPPPPAPVSYAAEYPNGYAAAADGSRGYYSELPPRQPAYPPPNSAQFFAPATTPSQVPSAPFMGGSRHARHQSTPNAPRPAPMGRTLSGPAVAPTPPVHAQYEGGPPPPYPHHGRHQSYAAARTTSMPRVDEDRDVYNARN